MQKSISGKLYSASDLVNFAACPHLTHLDLQNLDAPLPKAADTEEMALIQGKGFEHEARYLAILQNQYGKVVDLKQDNISDSVAFANTRQALHSGAPILFQATFLSAPWVGHADFLIRVDTPSRLGDFSYEVVDTKLARSSRAKFLLQLCLYSEMLAQVQGIMPRHMVVVLGDGRKETFLVADYLRYYRQLKRRFLDWATRVERESYPERCERCSMCRWRDLCSTQWEQDDHLNRVAGITRVQMPRLRAAGVSTMAALAKLPAQTQLPRIQADTKKRLSHQARLQVQTLASGKPVFELLPLSPGKGFERLPPPSDGDLFFDMEGNPLEDGGLEYLFGLYFFESGKAVFKTLWAHSRAEEKATFEAFIDFVKAHLARWPKAHVYHYAPYEPTALKRLMSLHGTREDAVDNLLRQRKLVDLAMSTCASNIVLLGDQMQLGQPIQGVHPGESGQSTLEYLLQGEATIAPQSGVFLNDTWRMHPDVCQFISEAVYDGRLQAEAKNANQRLVLAADAHSALKPTGIKFLAVEHDGCSQRSEAEAELIQGLFQSLLGQRYRDREGVEHAMGLANILVVAPYNQQVILLKRMLPEDARVGTVDKFQGQEAEVVLVSMTTSSGEYLPRDIEFLYSKNRLNVAVSRARCLAVVLANPKLLDVDCKTPAQMALVNTLCWVREYLAPNEVVSVGNSIVKGKK